MSATPDFFTKFTTASSIPVMRAVDFPETIQPDHPIRSLNLYVRYWPLPVLTKIQTAAKSGEGGWAAKLMWYIIAASTCRPDGELAFCYLEKWPEIFNWWVKKSVSDWEIAVNSFDWADCRPGMEEHNPNVLYHKDGIQIIRCPDFLLNDDNSYAVPTAIDYDIVGSFLQESWDSAQGFAIFGPICNAALSYNGWEVGEAKNSETTETSQPSGGTVKEQAVG